jgi:hypothetical protein
MIMIADSKDRDMSRLSAIAVPWDSGTRVGMAAQVLVEQHHLQVLGWEGTGQQVDLLTADPEIQVLRVDRFVRTMTLKAVGSDRQHCQS